ncbi:MAG: hypothetical protein Q9227_003331 [Pyrenula ochraceoflavens]
MAEIRKKHLTEGLQELSLRKETTARQTAARNQFHRDERARLLSQAEREDERLTSATIPIELQPSRGAQPSVTEAEVWIARKRNNAETHQRAKQEERQEALQALYVNSEGFITTEKELEDELEREFSANRFTAGSNQRKNVWASGPQADVDQLLRWRESTLGKTPSSVFGKTATTTYEDRLKRIGEELTGGKISDKKTPSQ